MFIEPPARPRRGEHHWCPGIGCGYPQSGPVVPYQLALGRMEDGSAMRTSRRGGTQEAVHAPHRMRSLVSFHEPKRRRGVDPNSARRTRPLLLPGSLSPRAGSGSPDAAGAVRDAHQLLGPVGDPRRYRLGSPSCGWSGQTHQDQQTEKPLTCQQPTGPGPFGVTRRISMRHETHPSRVSTPPDSNIPTPPRLGNHQSVHWSGSTSSIPKVVRSVRRSDRLRVACVSCTRGSGRHRGEDTEWADGARAESNDRSAAARWIGSSPGCAGRGAPAGSCGRCSSPCLLS